MQQKGGLANRRKAQRGGPGEEGLQAYAVSTVEYLLFACREQRPGEELDASSARNGRPTRSDCMCGLRIQRGGRKSDSTITDKVLESAVSGISLHTDDIAATLDGATELSLGPNRGAQPSTTQLVQDKYALELYQGLTLACPQG